MSKVRALVTSSVMAFAAIASATTTAHAAPVRKMLVLIDASGSMTIQRADLRTRFQAAKDRALSKIADEAGSGLTAVAVYTFSETTSTLQTAGGFVDPNAAITRINQMTLEAVGGGLTPLAGAFCDAAQTLTDEPADEKILELASDGEENFTPPDHPCFGPPSNDPKSPYEPGSWQNKVLNTVTDSGFAVVIDLLDSKPIVGPLAPLAARDPEARALGMTAARSVGLDAIGDGPPTLEEFFTEIARVSGGRLTVIHDEDPVLPVTADFDGNSCVDRSDALLLSRAIGQAGPPQDNQLDLDLDGVVGFADYAATLAHFTPGGCGTADPYVAVPAPIVCRASQPVVIDGKTLASGGITIDARGLCQITIKNSLIVAGSNAINVVGSALVIVDNSILVGAGAVLSSRGATILSAANTVFHGPKLVQGLLAYVDRGGNTWE